VIVELGAGAADTSPVRTVTEVTKDEKNRIFERETTEGAVTGSIFGDTTTSYKNIDDIW
jgi:hypothetical protein